jgi:hypothetical protein
MPSDEAVGGDPITIAKLNSYRINDTSVIPLGVALWTDLTKDARFRLRARTPGSATYIPVGSSLSGANNVFPGQRLMYVDLTNHATSSTVANTTIYTPTLYGAIRATERLGVQLTVTVAGQNGFLGVKTGATVVSTTEVNDYAILFNAVPGVYRVQFDISPEPNHCEAISSTTVRTIYMPGAPFVISATPLTFTGRVVSGGTITINSTHIYQRRGV